MSATTTSAAPAPERMSAEERREQILRAATTVFGAVGYTGATTDEIARAAGVSQPYVVRLFGTKQKLFLAALDRALDLLLGAFEGALPGDAAGRSARMGAAFVELLGERGLHNTLGHAFLLGVDPVIGPAARAGWAKMWRFLRERAGLSPEQAHQFLSMGMFINTMIGLRMSDDYGTDAAVTEIYDACIPEKAAEIIERMPRTDGDW